MSIGIIGAGALGSNVARLLARSGIPATIATSPSSRVTVMHAGAPAPRARNSRLPVEP